MKLVWVVLTLVAFAANSLLCRLALRDATIDPVSFTSLRVVSGALILLPLPALIERGARAAGGRGSWGSAVALFAYAIGFSLAYITLDAGTGALILFGCVQATMIGWALLRGDRPAVAEWVGLAVALGGLVYLVLPGLTAPDPGGAALMAAAGVAWGIYSLRGRAAGAPVATTAGNFVRAAPFALAVSIAAWAGQGRPELSGRGALLAVVSGAITSGLGYVIWYRALRDLRATPAAIVQLAVPVIAAIGGIALLGEPATARLAISGASILGGVALAITAHRR